jgi:succinate dehydrogenase / fumarate reductase iron-sulfur subunit
MQVSVKIKRFDPERRPRPWWQTFQIEIDATDRVLDALNMIKWYQDGSLTYRRSCAHGVCGSDAMMINGRNRLACQVLVKDMGSKISIEPMRSFPVIKDLVVDMEPFFAKYRSVLPYLITDDRAPEKERLQSQADRARYDDTTKCILCAACTTSCPSYWANKDYVGPAAIVNAHRFIFDSRDVAAQERVNILANPNGVWPCRTIFNCVEACPRDIDVTRAIEEVKKAALVGEV